MTVNKILNLLSLNGLKGYISGAAMLLLGLPPLLNGLAGLSQLLGDLLVGNVDIQFFMDNVGVVVNQVWLAATGLGIIGLRHAQSKTEKKLLESK